MGEAEDALRARQQQQAERRGAEEQTAADLDAERLRDLAEQTQALVRQALAALESAGFPGGTLLQVETLGSKTGFGKNRRLVSHETAAWEVYDGRYYGIDGGWFTRPTYLASNGKFVLTRTGLAQNRHSRSAHYYLDGLTPYSGSDKDQIDWLTHVAEGLARLAGRPA